MNEVVLNMNRCAIVRGGTNLHHYIPFEFTDWRETRSTCAQPLRSGLKHSHGECVWRFRRAFQSVFHADQA